MMLVADRFIVVQCGVHNERSQVGGAVDPIAFAANAFQHAADGGLRGLILIFEHLVIIDTRLSPQKKFVGDLVARVDVAEQFGGECIEPGQEGLSYGVEIGEARIQRGTRSHDPAILVVGCVVGEAFYGAGVYAIQKVIALNAFVDRMRQVKIGAHREFAGKLAVQVQHAGQASEAVV